MFQIKRVYEASEKTDGYRVLVDRLWPRGVSKEKAKLDLWLKDIGPSNELREWFAHDEKKWSEFVKKYATELHEKKEMLVQLRSLEREHKIVTMLYGARDTEHNEAVALLSYLK